MERCPALWVLSPLPSITQKKRDASNHSLRVGEKTGWTNGRAEARYHHAPVVLCSSRAELTAPGRTQGSPEAALMPAEGQTGLQLPLGLGTSKGNLKTP